MRKRVWVSGEHPDCFLEDLKRHGYLDHALENLDDHNLHLWRGHDQKVEERAQVVGVRHPLDHRERVARVSGNGGEYLDEPQEPLEEGLRVELPELFHFPLLPGLALLNYLLLVFLIKLFDLLVFLLFKLFLLLLAQVLLCRVFFCFCLLFILCFLVLITWSLNFCFLFLFLGLGLISFFFLSFFFLSLALLCLLFGSNLEVIE